MQYISFSLNNQKVYQPQQPGFYDNLNTIYSRKLFANSHLQIFLLCICENVVKALKIVNIASSSPFSTHEFRRRWRKILPEKNFISCSLTPSTVAENFQPLEGQNKFLQCRMNANHSALYIVTFRRRRQNGVENRGYLVFKCRSKSP